MRSDNDYADVQGAMGLVAVEWNLAGATSPDWMNGGTCSAQRIDSECLYGNNCERIFTDYSGGPGCYPATDTGRCFNDGVTCGHQLIEVRKIPTWPRSWANFSLLAVFPPECMGQLASFGPT